MAALPELAQLSGASLSEIAAAVGGARLRGSAQVNRVTLDSRDCSPGTLFCAVRGNRLDGHDYAADAVALGASALLVEHWLPLPVPQLRVIWARPAAGLAAAAVYGRPSEAMRVVGITGTNGKTTTSYLTHAALLAGQRRAGLVGTVEVRYPSGSQPGGLTTPDAPTLQAYFARMRAEGADTAVIEASSEGLDQHRLSGTRLALGVFLNLGREHLDYHGTMEHYYASKAMIVHPDTAAAGLVCIDDDWGRRLAAQARVPVTTFGFAEDADARIELLGTSLNGTTIRLHGLDGSPELRAPVVGAVNAPNLAAAYLAARHLGVPAGAAAEGIAGCEQIQGRFQLVDEGQPFLVVVDYAHTPDALQALIGTGRDLADKHGRVHVVVGARGGKDRMKRPLTARTAATADTAVLTTDSPGSEDPRLILAQLEVGLMDLPHRHVAIDADRRRAIRRAIGAAGPGDVVLIAGRGHEPTRRTATGVEHFDDREEAAAALRDRKSALAGAAARSAWATSRSAWASAPNGPDHAVQLPGLGCSDARLT